MSLSLFRRAAEQGDRIAIEAPGGCLTYQQLTEQSDRLAALLLDGREDLAETRVGYLVSPGTAYAVTQWAIWKAGGIAVPLALTHPRPELEYIIGEADADILIAGEGWEEKLAPIAEDLGKRYLALSDLDISTIQRVTLPDLEISRRGMMLFTSGTTGKPKGVVTTHRNIQAQITSLVQAWEWTKEDAILHVLPLHHIHGVINVLSCALWSGARVKFQDRFDARAVWEEITSGSLTLFMAVPTIYNRLIQAWQEAGAEDQKRWTDGCKHLRLMVCGSAALPVPVLETWRGISGHTLLERYGMTEIGMALSNSYRGERLPGYVGAPLPGVEVGLATEDGKWVKEDETPGEIMVRGDNVFQEYWLRPEETAKSFRNGWFRTGDTAVRTGPNYRILGRTSIDIIKTGGYKVSALEIEEEYLSHPAVKECAVVGIDHPDWGEMVTLAYVPAGEDRPGLEEFRAWGKERLAVYKVPGAVHVLEALPRNAMGKVVKPDLKKQLATP